MAIYDPKYTVEEVRRQTVNDLVSQMELYIQQEDFTHPGFYSLLGQLMPPIGLLRAITRMSERLKVPGTSQRYKDMVQRKIIEALYPYMVAYHKGLATEGQVLLGGDERDKRIKTIKTKSWRAKVKGRLGSGIADESTESTDIE